MSGRYGLQVRAATAADAAVLSELFEAAGHFVAVPALEGRLEAMRFQAGIVLLAQEWGPPSGLAAATWIRTLAADAPVACLDILLVAPADRRRGIGRVLLKAVAHAARAAGCDALRCRVPAGEDSLRAFCATNGFSEADALFRRPLRKRVGHDR